MENHLNICLNYHDFSGTDKPFINSKYTVGFDVFRRQLDLMEQTDNISLEGLISTDESHEISYCLTFDDGYKSHLKVAEELARRSLKGTFFIIKERSLADISYLNVAEIKEMSRMGMEFGSHSCTHRNLNRLDNFELLQELVESKQFLEDILSKPVYSLAFPGGHFGSREIALSFQAGYLLNRTSISGINYLPLKKGIIKSVLINSETDLDIFNNIIDLSQNFYAKAGIRQLLLSFPKYIESKMALTEY